MKHQLVSIVSPCYNVEAFIMRFLDSLINQTYKHLEIILVNDGSTDNTGNIIESYIPKLHKEGYIVRYFVQDNQGLAATINNGIKHVTGAYLTWPDPDDWLTPESIEKRVDFLESHHNVALVRCNIEKVEYPSGCRLGEFEDANNPPAPCKELFDNLLHVKTWLAPVGYMIRMNCFETAIPNREIYTTKESGQNIQMLLPIAYRYSCWQIPDILGYYTIRLDSHSQRERSYQERLNITKDFQNTLTETLKTLDGIPCGTFSNIIRKYTSDCLYLAKIHNKKRDIWKFSKELLYVTPNLLPKIRIMASAIYHCYIKPLIRK